MENKILKKWQPNAMVSRCSICESPADHVKHFGATACYSCRAFFRRTITNVKEYKTCTRMTDSCLIDSVNRTNCKKCRYKKCLLVGMKAENLKKIPPQEKKTKDINENKFKETKNVFANLKSSGLEGDDLMHTVTVATNNSIDINSLVEDCFSEEFSQCERFKGKQELLVMNSYLPFKWTHEEEFKMYELIVKKEMVLDRMFQIFFKIPNFLEAFEKALLSPSHDAFIKILDQNPEYVDYTIANDSTIRQSLDMFGNIENIDERIKIEVLQFSMPIFRVCARAVVMGNKDKLNFVDQHIAAGVFNKTFKKMYEKIFPKNGSEIRSYDPFSTKNFISPWAVKYDDEVFFLSTLKSVAAILKDDVHLRGIYFTLILSTPGAVLSEITKTDPLLQKLQDDLRLLLYRYLENKYGNYDQAVDTTNKLLRLLTDLHLCRDIFLFGRLPLNDDELFNATIEELEIELI